MTDNDVFVHLSNSWQTIRRVDVGAIVVKHYSEVKSDCKTRLLALTVSSDCLQIYLPRLLGKFNIAFEKKGIFVIIHHPTFIVMKNPSQILTVSASIFTFH